MKWKAMAGVAVLCGIAGSAGAVGRLADVAVHDRAQGRTLPVYQHDGRYYVVGRPGNEYQVRVHNRSGGDLLAVMSVDGINVVSGETAGWTQTGYVLGGDQAYDVRGWRKSLERIAAFFFTEHSNSYAARTGRPDHVGVIGVALFRRKVEPQAVAPRERLAEQRQDAPWAGAGAGAPAARSESSADAAGALRHPPSPQSSQKSTVLGTGHGRSEAAPVTYTSFERATAQPEEVISIYYDSYSNLVAAGVLRAPQVARPSPFPGQFVPDPR